MRQRRHFPRARVGNLASHACSAGFVSVGDLIQVDFAIPAYARNGVWGGPGVEGGGPLSLTGQWSSSLPPPPDPQNYSSATGESKYAPR